MRVHVTVRHRLTNHNIIWLVRRREKSLPAETVHKLTSHSEQRHYLAKPNFNFLFEYPILNFLLAKDGVQG